MDFQTLYGELFAHGWEDWNDASTGLTRAKRLVNESYKAIAEAELWPFLYTDTSGTAPLSITDVRYVLSVTDSTHDVVLQSIDRRVLNELYPDLPDTGNPTYWYLTSETSLAVYPANTTATIKVRYIKVPADLSATTDTPVIPTRYHHLIVQGAVARALPYKDNYEAAQFMQTQVDAGIQHMRESLLARGETPEIIQVVGPG